MAQKETNLVYKCYKTIIVFGFRKLNTDFLYSLQILLEFADFVTALCYSTRII